MRVFVSLLRPIICLALIAGAAPTPSAGADERQATPLPVHLSGFALPSIVYYGNCGIQRPEVVTIHSDFASDYSLRVTARYDYVSVDPRLPESTTLSAHMAQITTLTYGASIDVGSEAYAYLRGGSGVLRYQVAAVDALQSPSLGNTGSIRVEYCGA